MSIDDRDQLVKSLSELARQHKCSLTDLIYEIANETQLDWHDLHASLNIQETMRRIVVHAIRITRHDLIAVVLPQVESINICYGYPEDNQLSIQSLTLPLHPDIICLHPDDLPSFTELHDVEIPEYFTDRAPSSQSCIPLYAEGGIFAYISIEQFDDAEIQYLPEPFLKSATIALTNSLTHAALQQSEFRLSSLYQALSLLLKELPTTTMNVDQIGQLLVTAVVQQFELVDCGLILVEDKTGDLIRIARTGKYQVGTQAPLFVSGQGLIPHAIRSGETTYVPDVSRDSHYLNSEPETRSELVIPLSINGNVLGVLDLQSNELDAFNAGVIRIIEVFADRAAVIIENARLHTHLKAQNTALEQRVANRTRQLSEQAERLTSILNSNHDAIVLTNSHGRIRQSNDAFDELFGFSGDEAFNVPLSILLNPETVQAVEAFMNNSNEQRFRIETTVKTKRSQKVPLDLSIARIDGETMTGFVVNFHDITEHKAYETRLLRSEAQFRAVFESSTIAFIVIHHDFRVRSVNGIAEELTQSLYNRTLRVGDPILDFIFEADVQAFYGNFAIAATGQYVQFERCIADIRGNERWFDIQYNPVITTSGSIIAICMTLDEITEKKKSQLILEDALQRERELNELQSRVVATVSHELRTPLAVIQATSNKLEHYAERMDATRKQNSYIKINQQIHHLSQMIEDMLFVSKAQSAAHTFEPEKLDLLPFIQHIVDDLLLAMDRPFKVPVQLTGDCTDATVYKEPLHHVVSNLINNALKYSPENAPIEVYLNCKSDYISLIVKDSGIGIPEKDIEHLFTTFMRSSNVGNIPGTGVGLTVVKEAVDLHGGRILVDSKENEGTTFTVILPKYQGVLHAETSEADSLL